LFGLIIWSIIFTDENLVVIREEQSGYGLVRKTLKDRLPKMASRNQMATRPREEARRFSFWGKWGG
jgi:6-phosphogluconolactonase/glucosamine-6-phosphate isomerase/deaminase